MQIDFVVKPVIIEAVTLEMLKALNTKKEGGSVDRYNKRYRKENSTVTQFAFKAVDQSTCHMLKMFKLEERGGI